jgi:23S rRNA (guanosine2251-2'-O)-methyltransferase
MAGFTRNKSTETNFIIGLHPIEEAIDAGKSIERILIRKALRGDHFKDVFEKIRSNDIAFQFVPPQKLDSISRKNHQGVIALMSPVEFQNLDNLLAQVFEKGEVPLIVVLDEINDVRNFGAIVRSAECLGAHAVVIPHKGAARINESAVKASAGALLRMNICQEGNLANVVSTLQSSGLKVVGVTEKGASDLWDVDLTVPICLVMGSEEEGISEKILALTDQNAKIPMTGRIESLNVSVAAGILLTEVGRQRRPTNL